MIKKWLKLWDFNTPLEAKEFNFLKWGLGTSSVFYFLWRWLVLWYSPQSYEGYRFIPSSIILILLFLVTKNSKESVLFKKFHFFAYLSMLFLYIHYGLLSWINNFNPLFSFGFFIVEIGLLVLFTHYYQLVSFLAISLIHSLLIYSLMQNNWIQTEIFLAWNLTIVSLVGLAVFFKIYFFKSYTQSLLHEKETQKQLMVASRMSTLGEIAAGVGHEINNPLMIMSGRLQMLKMKKPELASELLVLENQIQRISKITKSLKKMSTFQADKNSSFFYNELTTEIDPLIQSRLSSHNLNFKILPTETDFKVKGNLSDVTQVLINLVVNAIDAVDKQATPEIKMYHELSKNWVNIVVQDNGPGISLENQDKIFNAFFTTKEIGKGTGLGLSISRQLVEKNGGKLEFETSSSGTKFIVSLPIE